MADFNFNAVNIKMDSAEMHSKNYQKFLADQNIELRSCDMSAGGDIEYKAQLIDLKKTKVVAGHTIHLEAEKIICVDSKIAAPAIFIPENTVLVDNGCTIEGTLYRIVDSHEL